MKSSMTQSATDNLKAYAIGNVERLSNLINIQYETITKAQTRIDELTKERQDWEGTCKTYGFS